MIALRRFEKSPRAARIEETPMPTAGAGEVLLKVKFCGVCGSDLHAYLNHAGYESVLESVTFGHELSGVVEKVGEGVSGWSVGERATMVAIQAMDENCRYVREGLPQLSPSRRVQGLHLDGGMAEYIVVDQRFLLKLPENLNMQHAALTEPLSVADHCVVNCSRIKAGDKIVVSGPGIIGMLCAVVARHHGAEVIVSGTAADEKVRLRSARKIGFQTVQVGSDNAPLHEQVRSILGQEVDGMIEASGASPALADAWKTVRTDGLVSVVALYGRDVTMDMTQFVRKQIGLQTCYGSAIPSYERAMKMLKDGVVPVEELVRLYDLKDGISAFTDAENQEVMKPMLNCTV
jgi:L-iditol 2-dehydrogenase